MSKRGRDKSASMPMNPDEMLEPTALRALSILGHRMPTTEEEVHDQEAWASKQPLSERMSSRTALFGPRRGMPSLVIRRTETSFQESAGNLARAAREGGSIPPEVEEQMRLDRECAESDDTGNAE